MTDTELFDAMNACLELCRRHGFATGHGDTLADIIREISGQISERDARIAEIDRLQQAKSAALKVADERAIDANGLRQQLASANERVAEMQYDAGIYQSLYELSGSRLAKAKLALENIAAWRKVNMVGEFEHGLRDIIRSMTDCAANALDSLTDDLGK